MSDIETKLRTTRDSDNSYPINTTVEIDRGEIVFTLYGPDRTIAFNLRSLKRVIALLEEEGDNDGDDR